MARAARMIEGHLEGILAHWTQGLTTAFMEGLNSIRAPVFSITHQLQPSKI
jgi:transposase